MTIAQIRSPKNPLGPSFSQPPDGKLGQRGFDITVQGSLVMTHGLRCWTNAKALQPGVRSEAFVAFSAARQTYGDALDWRQAWGFTLKVLTDEGEWDLLGANIPVASVRDPGKLAGLRRIEAIENAGARSAAAWDFWSRSPESLHYVTILYSDRGRPESYRRQHGYGGYAYSLIDDDGERAWVKFHFNSMQGVRRQVDGRAVDADHLGEDLLAAIAAGDAPCWRVYAQIMTPTEAAALPFDPFDPTKVWPHGRFPLVEAGILQLERPLDPSGRDDLMFSPANLIPGIGLSPDPLLLDLVQRDVDTPLRPAAPDTRTGDDYEQAGDLFRLMSNDQKARLCGNIASALAPAPIDTQQRQLSQFYRADPVYGAAVARALAEQATAP